VRDDSHAVLGQKFSGQKGSVRRYVVVMQQSDLLSPKFGAVFAHVTVVCRIDCMACQEDFFVNYPLDAKEHDEHALDFVLHPSHLLQSR
jgi:hypothetical protein